MASTLKILRKIPRCVITRRISLGYPRPTAKNLPSNLNSLSGLCFKSFSTSIDSEEHLGRDSDSMKHFRNSRQKHPLNIKKNWKNPTQNHVWSNEEIDALMKDLPSHTPVTWYDKAMHFLVKSVLYNGFNWVTSFDKSNPTARSCEWRLIVLESVAGCPGMVAAAIRHFRSLRTLQRDHGWIHTLLEEAENERMHLLVCMNMFNIILAQYGMVAFLTTVYIIKPKALHRFVGYLEETASQTYYDLIKHCNTPGTHLSKDWAPLMAPEIAKNYWNLGEDAKWVDVLRCLFADETNHRDVNHTFASMETDDPNPFVSKHLDDAAKAWQIEEQQKKSKKE